MQYLLALVFGCGLIGLVIYFARQDGERAERLAALKREIKERENAQTIIDNVRRTNIDSVREKLKQTK